MSDTILTWNPAAEALFDVPIGSALARKFRDLDVSYRVEGVRARIEDVKGRRAPIRMDDVTFSRRNGEVLHADITIAPLFEAYRLIGVLVYASEATEVARLKEQMTRVAEQHATAIEELQSTNEELETTNEELQSTNEELETTNEELQSANEELQTTVEELRAINTELTTVNAELERRTAALRQLDRYHKGVVDASDEALFVLDRALSVTTWNRRAAGMWGLRKEDAVGREFSALPIGDVTRLTRPALEALLSTRRRQTVERVPYVKPGGLAGEVTLRLAPVLADDAELLGIIGTAAVDGGPPEGTT